MEREDPGREHGGGHEGTQQGDGNEGRELAERPVRERDEGDPGCEEREAQEGDGGVGGGGVHDQVWLVVRVEGLQWERLLPHPASGGGRAVAGSIGGGRADPGERPENLRRDIEGEAGAGKATGLLVPDPHGDGGLGVREDDDDALVAVLALGAGLGPDSSGVDPREAPSRATGMLDRGEEHLQHPPRGLLGEEALGAGRRDPAPPHRAEEVPLDVEPPLEEGVEDRGLLGEGLSHGSTPEVVGLGCGLGHPQAMKRPAQLLVRSGVLAEMAQDGRVQRPGKGLASGNRPVDRAAHLAGVVAAPRRCGGAWP